jgi:glutathione S-transferase
MADTARPEAIVVWGVGTTRTMRVHWALHELGLAYESRPIGSRTGETRSAEFSALNPRQKIPVLQLGDLTLAESGAIVTTLGERFAPGRLVPEADTPERARYYQWCFWVLMELDAHTLYVMRRHGDLSDLYGEAPAAIEAAREYFDWQLDSAAREIAERGPYLLGDSFSGADILLTTCLDWALAYRLPIGDVMDGYRTRIVARDAYRSAFQQNFAEMLASAKPG